MRIPAETNPIETALMIEDSRDPSD